MTVFIILAVSLLALTTANLGISVRQKWMVFPFIIYMSIAIIGNKKNSLALGRNK